MVFFIRTIQYLGEFIRERHRLRLSSRFLYGKENVQELIKKYKRFSNAVFDGNTRFRALMCTASKSEYDLAYKAAKNALNHGVDYANGGCFWDGADLKSGGEKHFRFIQGFYFTDEKHNIYDVSSPPFLGVKTPRGSYDYKYESTAAHGGTIFWKVNQNYLKAEGALQCH